MKIREADCQTLPSTVNILSPHFYTPQNHLNQTQRSPGEGNGNPLQYSCLGNPMDRGAWWATVHGGHKESDTTERLTTKKTILLKRPKAAAPSRSAQSPSESLFLFK